MKVTYIDPTQRALFAAELPGGGYGVWAQKGKDVPRKLVSKGYIDPAGYPSFIEAQEALGHHVSVKRSESSFGSWEVYVNGKATKWDDYHAMNRGEMRAPGEQLPAAQVTLANIEYRIAHHVQGAYENMLHVGQCLNEAKEAGLVPHGEWENWVRTHAQMSERQAQKLMQAARRVPPGSAMERLPISKIQVILALPEEEREPVAEKAADEGMGLRALQAEVKQHKRRAENAERLLGQAEGAAAEAKMRAGELQLELNHALLDFPAVGISPEAQVEIDRLKAEIGQLDKSAGKEINRLQDELNAAEKYAEQQAGLRQEAQREMLGMQSQAARGEVQGGQGGMTPLDLAAAVRAFIGSAGVLPHMGVELSRIVEADRQQIRQHVDMVAAWVDGSRQALGVIMVEV